MSPLESSINTLRTYFNRGATKSINWRLQQLDQLQQLVVQNRPQIHQALMTDLNKCEFEAIVAETSVIETEIDYIKRHLKKWMRPEKVSSPLLTWPAKSHIQAEPLGVVCILGAWNYPFNLSVRPLLAAIAAGNCAILKPSELAPATSSLLTQLIPQYLDCQAVQCIEGDGDFAGELLGHRFDHIFYTGSANIAKKVMTAAAQYLTPVTLELGGKSPCLIDSSADIRITAKRVAWSKWLNAGQTCIAPDYVLVDQQIADRFVAALIHELKAFYGDCAKSSDSYGRIINRRHTERLASALEDQEVVFGGDVDLSQCYISPTIVREPSMQSQLMQHEIFGPILPVISVADKQQMIDIVNSSEKPLALYSYAKDDHFNREVVANISAGNVCINDGMMFMANQNLPFGGVGESGMGSYGGYHGFKTFSHFKSVMKRYFKFDVALRYPPFTASKARWMARVRWFG